MKGEGVPDVRTDRNGNQHVRVTIAVPKKVTKQQKQLLTQLSEDMGDAVSALGKKKRFF